MKYPIRKRPILDNYEQRVKMFIGLDARKLDCAVVEIPLLCTGEMAGCDQRGEGWTYERLREESLSVATYLYSQPYRRLFPESVLVPYAEITLTDSDRERARLRLQVASIVGRVEMDDQTRARYEADDDEAQIMQRVKALGDCFDLLEYLRPKSQRGNAMSDHMHAISMASILTR